MFNFLSMVNNYEDRKVDRFEEEGCIIDTCSVTDSDQPYETGIQHPQYNDGGWIIVEMYDGIEDAQEGHKKWVKKMTADELPDELLDVGTSGIAKLLKLCEGR